MTGGARIGIVALAIAVTPSWLGAHSGPPFPILTDAVRGPYRISIWTDPDATNDGTQGGQFWIVIEAAQGGVIPAETRATVTVKALSSSSSPSAAQSTPTEPVRGDVTNQFGAVLMDHEGPYAVHVEVTGPLGLAAVDAMVDATDDLRPAPFMLAWYLFPFLLVGFLWTRLLLRRRKADRVHLP